MPDLFSRRSAFSVYGPSAFPMANRGLVPFLWPRPWSSTNSSRFCLHPLVHFDWSTNSKLHSSTCTSPGSSKQNPPLGPYNMLSFNQPALFQASKCYVTHGVMGHLDPKQLPTKSKPWSTLTSHDFVHRVGAA